MIEPELKELLTEINNNLGKLQKSQARGVWHSFFSGLMGALGYTLGIVLVIAISGWTLNKYGYLDSAKAQLKNIQDLTEQMKSLSGSGAQQSSSMNGSKIILPDGREVQIQTQK